MDFKNIEDRVMLIISVFFFIFCLLFMGGTALKSGMLSNYLKAESSVTLTTNLSFYCSDFTEVKDDRCGTADRKVLQRIAGTGSLNDCSKTYISNNLTLCADGKNPSVSISANSYGACGWTCGSGINQAECSFIFENSNCPTPNVEGIDYSDRKCLAGYYPNYSTSNKSSSTHFWKCNSCQYYNWSNCADGVRTRTSYSGDQLSCPPIRESCSDGQFGIISVKIDSSMMTINWNDYYRKANSYYYKLVYSNTGSDIYYPASQYTPTQATSINTSPKKNYYYRVCYHDGTNKVVCTHNAVYVNSSGEAILQEVGQLSTDGGSTPGTVGVDTCTGVNCSICGTSSGKSFEQQPSSDLCNTNSVLDGTVIANDAGWTWQCKTPNGVSNACNASRSNTCGPASSNSFLVKPDNGLCTIGGANVIDKGDYWTWTCGDKECSAKKEVPIDECGDANGKSFLVMPTESLCKQGAYSGKAKTGTWNWACGSITCSALIMINGECGSAKDVASEVTPSSDLCKSGESTNMYDDYRGTELGRWRWYCSGKNDGRTVECIAPIKAKGVCGSSIQGAFTAAPTSNLCSIGKESIVSGSGPWTWTCSGFNGGASATCTANKVVTSTGLKGECGASNGKASYSKPTDLLCNKGTSTEVVLSGDKWTWSCSVSSGEVSASCSANKMIDGKCGNSNNQTLSTVPKDGLCSAGTSSIVTGTGPWYWSCSGFSGGVTDKCSASLLDSKKYAKCGASNGGTFSSIPSSDLCQAGSLIGSVSGTGPWTWTCGGEGMETSSCGASVSCSYDYAYGDCVNGVQSVVTKRKPESCVDTITPITSRQCKLGECNYQYTDWVCSNGMKTRQLIGNYSNCSNAPLLISTCDNTINCIEDKWTCGWSDCRAYLDGYYKLYSCILEPKNDCPSVDNRKAPETQKEKCAPYGQSTTPAPSTGTTPSQGPSTPAPSTGTTPSQGPSTPAPSTGTTPSQGPSTPVPSTGTTPSQGPSTPAPSQSSIATPSIPSSGSTGALPQQVVVTATTENLTPECEEAGIKISRNCNTYMSQLNIIDKCLSLGVKTKDLCRQLLEESGVVTKCDQLEKSLSAEESKRQCDIMINDVILGEFDIMISEETSKQLEGVVAKPVVIDTVNNTIKTDASSNPISVKVPFDASNAEVPASLIPIIKADNSTAQSPVAIIFDSDGNGIPDELDRRLKELGITKDNLTSVEKAIVDKKPLEQPKDKKLVSSVLTVDIENIETGVRFKGRGYPNEVSTLFIYSSIPIIVTVKSDENGNWIYDLDRRLSSGKHEVYVAINDSEGKLLEASVPKMFFVAEARAISLDDYLGIQPANTSNFVEKTDSTIKNYVIGGGIIVIMLIIAFLLLKRVIVNKHEGQ
jgi:hypothetical protein